MTDSVPNFPKEKRGFINNTIRQFSSEGVKKLFDVEGNQMKED
jgi:hypothetical protein